MLAPQSIFRFDTQAKATGSGVSVLERARYDAASAHAAAKPAGGLYSLPGVIAVVLAYSTFHVGARLIASGNLGEDDPLEAIVTQTLQLGYFPGTPPLYDWLLWLVTQVTGPGALPFQLIKYGLLTGTCAFVFLAARRVMKGDAVWALLSVEALALIYQISWRFHEGFTHAVAAMCAVAATFWALTRLAERRGWGDFLVLGLCIGAGVLTVATYWVFLGALIVAACLQPALRRVLLSARIVLSLGLAAAIAAPHYSWLAHTPEGIAAMLPAFVSDGKHGHWHFVLEGVRRAFTEPVMYLSPLMFILPLFFPRMIRNLRNVALAPNASPEPDYEQLILHLTLVSLGALLVGAVVWGINRYPVHALMPLFLITSIWLTAQARKAVQNAAQVRRFAIAALSIAVFAFFARAANMYVLEPVCNLCRWGVPYEELAENIMKTCHYGRVSTYDVEIAGNLRRFFYANNALHRMPIVLVGARAYTPPLPPMPNATPPCETAYVWPASDSTEVAAAKFGISPDVLAQPRKIDIPWRHHLWKPDGYRYSRWRVAPWTPSNYRP